MSKKCKTCGLRNSDDNAKQCFKCGCYFSTAGAGDSPSPQGIASTTCSAPERSGEVEAGVGQLVSSAPVERFSALAERFWGYSRTSDIFARRYADIQSYSQAQNYKVQSEIWTMAARNVEQLIAENSGQRSGQKAESAAEPPRRSGAQARNDQAET